MDYKIGIIFLSIFFLILFSGCKCRDGGEFLSEISFSILDEEGNDLLDNNSYDPNIIELTADGNRIYLNRNWTVVPYRIFISHESNGDLTSLNPTEYYLKLNDNDIDTIGLQVTELVNECGNVFYEPIQFSHNGNMLEKSQYSNPVSHHYILVK